MKVEARNMKARKWKTNILTLDCVFLIPLYFGEKAWYTAVLTR